MTLKFKYVERSIAKGRAYYRYRREGLRIPLPDDPMSAEFAQCWRDIHEGFEKRDSADLIIPGSIAAMIADFKKSAEYNQFAQRTKELYSDHLDDIQKRFGPYPVQAMTRNVVLTYRDSYGSMPGKANNAIKILSRLYSFAIDRGAAALNPVHRVKKLKMGTHRPWADEELKLFYDKAPAHIRLAFTVALYTGQRQSDVIKLRWNQIKDGGIALKQEKGGRELWIPIHSKLVKELENAPRHAVTIVATVNGRPYKRMRFVHEWIDKSVAAGLPDDCVFHGLRKTAAVYLAEAGCTDEQIQSITGHTTKRMVEHYTRGANQKTLARAAIKKFERRK